MRAASAFRLLSLTLAAGCQKAPSTGPEAPAREPAPTTLQTFTEGEGPPLLMLGGVTDGAAAFAPYTRSLAADFSVVRPQALRIERSQSRQPLPPGYSIKAESAAVARSPDELRIVGPVGLVGH